MTPQIPSHQNFTKEEIDAFAPVMKIGLLATITSEGLPHITMLSSLKAADEKTMTWASSQKG